MDGVVRAARPRHSPSKSPKKIQNRAILRTAQFIKGPAVRKLTARTKRRRLKKLLPSTRRQALFTGASLVVLVLSILAFRFFWTSCKVFVCKDGDGALALQDNVDPTKLRGEGDGRVNILLIGIGGERHVGGDLSDSIVIASLDPISKDVAILSVPRDLYLPIPNYGKDRVNAAHAYGERDNYPGGGPALLKETISQALGVPIHYYARADFDGFKEAINAVGEVEVDVSESIYDYSYPNERTGGYETFQLSAGRQFMNGDTALKYVRSRYSTSDFDRSERQQKLMVAVKDKATSLGTLSNPLKISSLLSSVGNHVKTDLRPEEMAKLTQIAKEVAAGQIARARLDNSPDNYLASANVGGASVLVPRSGDFSQIQAYVRSLFVDGFIKKEAARVEILNGTESAGKAAAVAEILKTYGYQVVSVADAPEKNHARSEIYDYNQGAKPYTLRYLEQRFGAKSERRSNNGSNPDLTLVIGSDYHVAF